MSENKEPEITPCPFCGGKVNVYKYNIIYCFYFKCIECEMTSGDYDGENAYQDTIDAANRRA